MVAGLAQGKTEVSLVWKSDSNVLDGCDHPIRVLTCDLNGKKERGRMSWKLEGEPGDYVCLTYLTNDKARKGYIVALDSYENLRRKAVDGWVTCVERVESTGFYNLRGRSTETDEW